MSGPSLTVAAPLLVILLTATVIDLRTQRIPNGLSFGGTAYGLLANVVAFGPSALGFAALGWALCLVCFLPLYMTRGTAAGDVKLMAMVGAFLGPLNGFVACLLTLVAGALLALLSLVWRNLSPRFRGVAPPFERSSQPRSEPLPAANNAAQRIPYAAAIALGGAAAVLQPRWVASILS